MTLHSPKFDGHKIFLTDLTCLECSIETFCDDCKTLKQINNTNVISPEKNEYLELTDIEKTDSNNNKDAHFHDDYDQGQTDEADESSEDEEGEFSLGDVIWAKLGRIWYPVRICSFNDVLNNLQHRFCLQNNKVIIKLLISQFI